MQNDDQHTIEEFTKQAVGFADAPQIRDEEALCLVCTLTQADGNDTVLDVACGPGILTCSLAERVGTAVGIDITPAMIDLARQLQHEKQLDNVKWCVGNTASLPWPEDTFSMVVCRYAFHHFNDPAGVLREMTRVCRPHGRVAVIDVALAGDQSQVDKFNHMERLRDPSHVKALRTEELHGLFRNAGLPNPRVANYRLEFELNALLNGSFPVEGGTEIIRRMIVDSVSDNSLGLNPAIRNNEIWCSYPISVFVAHKSGEATS